MTAQAPVILAAEDEEDDRFLLELAFRRGKLTSMLVTVRDGRECVDYLSGDGEYADRVRHPLPALLLLDLKMPRMHGFEVLKWLATRPEFNALPVFVLSSSSDDADIEKSLRLGARDYFVKPHMLDDLVKILHDLQSRWLPVATAAVVSGQTARS